MSTGRPGWEVPCEAILVPAWKWVSDSSGPGSAGCSRTSTRGASWKRPPPSASSPQAAPVRPSPEKSAGATPPGPTSSRPPAHFVSRIALTAVSCVHPPEWPVQIRMVSAGRSCPVPGEVARERARPTAEAWAYPSNSGAHAAHAAQFQRLPQLLVWPVVPVGRVLFQCHFQQEDGGARGFG